LCGKVRKMGRNPIENQDRGGGQCRGREKRTCDRGVNLGVGKAQKVENVGTVPLLEAQRSSKKKKKGGEKR